MDADVDAYDYHAPIDPSKRHFQPGAFYPDRPDLDLFIQNWYDRQLIALEEPRIYDASGTEEVYRFTWLRTWHNPIAVRMTLSADTATLEWKRTDGASGYDPGKLSEQGSRQLTTEEVVNLRKAFGDLDPWSLPTRITERGCDGAQWLLELKRPGRYDVVDRWSPGKKSAYAKCCMLLLEYSGLRSLGAKY